MDTNDDSRSLISGPDVSLEKATAKPFRVVSEIVEASLALARAADQLAKQRFRIGTFELCRPDYEQVLLWAEKLALKPEETLTRLFDESYCNSEKGKYDYPWPARTEVVDGHFRKIHWDFARLPLKRFECERELQLTHLSFTPVAKFRRARLMAQRARISSLDKANTSQAIMDYERKRLADAERERQGFEALSYSLEPAKMAFPNLTHLGCAGLALSELNVRGFPLLEELHCAFNLLERIDLHSAPKLRVLDCSENELMRLDLSAVSSLQAIDCSWNQIDELDLSAVEKLSTLQCNKNLLTKVDLSPVSLLRSLQLGQNQLGSLDVSQSTQLREIYVVENHLTELDVSGLRELEFLNCMSNEIQRLVLGDAIKLQVLHCDDNALSELQLSEAPNLRVVSCCDNALSELRLWKAPNLSVLSCGNDLYQPFGNKIYELDLRANRHLEELECSNLALTRLDLSRTPNLRELNCYYNDLTKLNLSSVPNLRSLACSGTFESLDLRSVPQLEKLTFHSDRLRRLELSHTPRLKSLELFAESLEQLDIRPLHGLELFHYEGNARVIQRPDQDCELNAGSAFFCR